MLLSKAAEWHLLAARATQKSPGTLHSYEVIPRLFITFVSESLREPPTLAHLTLENARAWQVHLGDRGLSATTIYHYTRVIRTWTKWLVEEFASSLPGAFPSGDPLARLKCPRRDEKEPSVLSRGQVELLITFAETTRDPLRNKAILLLMVESGLRNAETCHILRDNIKYAGSKDIPGEASVFGKGRKGRRVCFGLRASKAIQAYEGSERGDSDSPYLFISHYGTPLTPGALRKLCTSLKNKTGIVSERVHPHVLRHTFANMRVEAGMSLIAIQNQLGHSRLEQTRRYTRRALMDPTKNYLSIMDKPMPKEKP